MKTILKIIFILLLFVNVNAQTQDTTLTSKNSIELDLGIGRKQLEIGRAYNYKDINEVWKKGSQEIEIWADTSQFGNTIGRWKGTLAIEFPDTSTGEVTVYKRDG